MTERCCLRREPSILRGLVAGGAAGFLGCLAMAGFQELVARSSDDGQRRDHGPHAPSAGQENTTEKAARNVARQFGRRLTLREKQQAGRALHYGFGTFMGMFFGVAAEYLPIVGLGAGTAFGTVLFLATDEATLPLLNLASRAGETPAADHLLHWASHAVYGTSMELTRRALVRHN